MKPSLEILCMLFLLVLLRWIYAFFVFNGNISTSWPFPIIYVFVFLLLLILFATSFVNRRQFMKSMRIFFRIWGEEWGMYSYDVLECCCDVLVFVEVLFDGKITRVADLYSSLESTQTKLWSKKKNVFFKVYFVYM